MEQKLKLHIFNTAHSISHISPLLLSLPLLKKSFRRLHYIRCIFHKSIKETKKMSRPVSWKLNLAMLWFSQLVILAGFQALIPFVPLFIKNELGIVDEAELAFAVSAFNFFGTMAYAIFNPIWGVLADRFGVKPMLLRGTFLTGIFFFPLHLIGILFYQVAL